MKKMNFWLCSVSTLCIAFLLASSVDTYAVSFSDVKSTSWYYNDLATLSQKGIIKGYTDGTFRPNEVLNKNQFLALIVRALTGEDYKGTENSWASGIIKKARELKIIERDGVIKTDGYYNQPITKAEVATMATYALEYKGETYPSGYNKYLYTLRDYTAFNSDIKDSILKMYYKGIVVGYTDGKFKPLNKLTRSEATAIISRILDKEKRQSVGEITTEKEKSLLNDYPKEYKSNYKFTTDFDLEKSKAGINRIDEIIAKATAYVEDIEYGVYKIEYRMDDNKFINRFATICGVANVYVGEEMHTYANYARSFKYERDITSTVGYATFTTSKNLIYQTSIGSIKVRGIARVMFETSNDKNIDTNKIYEIPMDVELTIDSNDIICAKKAIKLK